MLGGEKRSQVAGRVQRVGLDQGSSLWMTELTLASLNK